MQFRAEQASKASHQAAAGRVASPAETGRPADTSRPKVPEYAAVPTRQSRNRTKLKAVLQDFTQRGVKDPS